MRQALFIARKDILYTLKDRSSLVWIFVIPIVMIYFIGTITGGGGGGSFTQFNIAMKVPPDGGYLVEQLERRLEDNDFKVVRFDQDGVRTNEDGSTVAFEEYGRRLIVPAGFTDNVAAGEPVKLRLDAQLSALQQSYVELRVRRAIYTLLADVVATNQIGEGLSQPALEAFNAMPRALTLEVSPAGERLAIPSGFDQAVPGIMIMFTMIVLLTSGAILLLIERQQGMLRRLAATPLTRGQIVLGKWGGKLALGVIQISFAFLVGTFLFGMDWGPDIPMVLLVLLGWGAFCASLGILLGSLGRTEGQVAGLGVLTSMVLAALGGCWWPIEVTPRWMQSFARILPSGIAMDALHQLVSFRAGAASALPHVLTLAAATFVVGLLARRYFRFE